LNTVLKENTGSSSYDFIESYAMKKIRRLVISNDFKFAEQAILVVIDNNLDNTEAVEMYSSIEDSLEKQEAYERQQEQLRIAEQQRIEKEKNAQKKNADKEFQSAKTASGASVYITGREEKFSSSYWSGRFGVADLMLASQTPDDYTSLRYGLAAGITWEYSWQKKLVFGVDAAAEGFILSVYNDDRTMMGSIKLVPELSFAGFNKNIFLRAGFAGLITTSSSTSDTVLHRSFYTPVTGIGFNHVRLGDITLSGFYDYYPGHLFYDDMNSAMGAGLTATFLVAEMEKVKLNFNTGFNDNMYITKAGMENHAGIILSIGVENVAQ
jgi:hypothetical protein